MTFFCRNCWTEMASDQQICGHCGAKVSSWDDQAFTAKLVQALSHPEPATQMRAVYLLGETKTASALGALAQLYRNTVDPFLQAEIVKSVDKIGGDSAFGFLTEALANRSFIVRREAAKALKNNQGNGSVEQALENRDE